MRSAAYVKMLAAGVVCCVGGPALVWYVSPTEEELFKKYNPELQKRSLEGRYQKQKDFDDFVNQLKEHARSDKPIWSAQKEAEARNRQAILERERTGQQELADSIEKRKQEIRRQSSTA